MATQLVNKDTKDNSGKRVKWTTEGPPRVMGRRYDTEPRVNVTHLVDEYIRYHEYVRLLKEEEKSLKSLLRNAEDSAILGNPTAPAIHGSVGSIRVVVVEGGRKIDEDLLRDNDPELWAKLIKQYPKVTQPYHRWQTRIAEDAIMRLPDGILSQLRLLSE